MIEIAKLVTGAKINRPSPPVEPARPTQSASAEVPAKQEEVVSLQSSAAVVSAPVAEQSKKPEKETLDQTVDKANRQLESLNTSLRFKMDQSSDRVIISLVQSETGETIRQFPPEELLKMSANLQKVIDNLSQKSDPILGVLVDKKH